MSNNFVPAVLRQLVCSVVLLCCVCAARAQFTVPSDGSDGAFEPTVNTEIDLGRATTGPWNSTPIQGYGVYDPDQWIVVFKYSRVTIPSGVTVTFKNHPKNPPVVWLVQGDVTINGRVDLSGKNGIITTGARGLGGPGGFAGGTNYSYSIYSSGFGMGGGLGSTNGSYIDAANGMHSYGNTGCFPLVGGSGGAAKVTNDGSWPRGGGGGGGGAFLLASSTKITVAVGNSSGIYADGGGMAVYVTDGPGWSSGSGGMIRLVAPIVTGGGVVRCSRAHPASPAGWLGLGKIRIESNQANVNSMPAHSSGALGTSLNFLRDTGTPSVRVVTVNSVAVPPDPLGIGGSAGPTPVVASSSVTIVLECRNVPSNGTVTVRLASAEGIATSTINANFTSGNTALSTWTAVGNLGVTQGLCGIQARAVLPTTP